MDFARYPINIAIEVDGALSHGLGIPIRLSAQKNPSRPLSVASSPPIAKGIRDSFIIEQGKPP
jgi:hypothetical protein